MVKYHEQGGTLIERFSQMWVVCLSPQDLMQFHISPVYSHRFLKTSFSLLLKLI